jgi:hypothetical protein
VAFEQTFGIHFVPFVASIENFNAGSLANRSQSPKSGNPGYQNYEPLLVSRGLSGNMSEQVNANGFFLQASDPEGKCIAGDISLNNFSVERLDFNKYITMSCSVQFKTENEFKTYCVSGKPAQHKIFAQLSNITKLGIFGNANSGNSQDWLKVLNTVKDAN